MVFLDEFGDYVNGQNDSLKEDLRKSDGVPHATYGVLKDGQVFVFDKWAQRVNERQKRQLDLPLANPARGLTAEATVSARGGGRDMGYCSRTHGMEP